MVAGELQPPVLVLRIERVEFCRERVLGPAPPPVAEVEVFEFVRW